MSKGKRNEKGKGRCQLKEDKERIEGNGREREEEKGRESHNYVI